VTVLVLPDTLQRQISTPASSDNAVNGKSPDDLIYIVTAGRLESRMLPHDVGSRDENMPSWSQGGG